MKKLSILYFAGILLLAVSCIDLTDVYSRLDALEGRMDELTQTTATANSAFTIANALKDKVYVESVTENADGYVIKFTDGKTATIKNGNDGNDGKDATAPTIGVTDGEGGALYWTVNGEVMKDAKGNPVNASVAIPEFKFDNNKWWYRFGAEDTWKDCGEKTGPEPSITETDEFVIISIGDKTVQIPKEVISPAIEAIKPVITISRNNLFVPVGESIDLKDFFTVEPEGALKSMVEYKYNEAAPFTITEKGILTVTGSGSYKVDIVSKANPDIKLAPDFYVRTAECPNNEVPASTVNPEQKVKIFEGSLDEYNSFIEHGGTTAWNPVNNSHSAIANGGNINFRFGSPVVQNPNLTMENARLHFMFYVSDPSALQSAPFDGVHFLEVSSAGAPDACEVNFELPLFVPNLKAGWNEVDLPFSAATNPNNTGGPFDVTKVNYIRFLCPVASDGKWIAFQVKDLFAYEGKPSENTAFLFHSCDNTDYFTKNADANRTIEIVKEGAKEGAGWYKSTTVKQAEMIVINRINAPLDAQIKNYDNAHLSFWFYIEAREDGNNAQKLTKQNRINGGRVELSNHGGNQGLYWETKDVLKNLNDGWNQIDLALKDAKPYGNVESYTLNLAKVGWFRIYMNGPAALYDTFTYGIDAIQLYEAK